MRKLVDGLYLITPKIYKIHNIELSNKSHNLPVKINVLSNNSTYFCHLRFGHINLKKINRLVKEGPLSSLIIQLLPACASCLEEKMTKWLFSAKGNRSKGVLELIHIDVCGILNVRARRGFEYFITFIVNYSRYGYVYLLYRTFEAFKLILGRSGEAIR